MWWRTVFIAAVCFLLILLVTVAAAAVGQRSPAWFTSVLIFDLVIVLGGVKTIVDTTKAAGDVVKLGFDVQKLQLEIKSLQRDDYKAGARIVAPTDAQIERFASLAARLEAKSMGSDLSRTLISGSSLLIALAALGTTLFIFTESRQQETSTVVTSIRGESRVTFACGRANLVVDRGEILFSSAEKNFPPSHVTIQLPEGRIVFPLKAWTDNPKGNSRTYIANSYGNVRFRVYDAQIGIESDDGSAKSECSPINEERPNRP
jgi:hypothetical protein